MMVALRRGELPPRIKNSQTDDFGVFYDEGNTSIREICGDGKRKDEI